MGALGSSAKCSKYGAEEYGSTTASFVGSCFRKLVRTYTSPCRTVRGVVSACACQRSAQNFPRRNRSWLTLRAMRMASPRTPELRACVSTCLDDEVEVLRLHRVVHDAKGVGVTLVRSSNGMTQRGKDHLRAQRAHQRAQRDMDGMRRRMLGAPAMRNTRTSIHALAAGPATPTTPSARKLERELSPLHERTINRITHSNKRNRQLATTPPQSLLREQGSQLEGRTRGDGRTEAEKRLGLHHAPNRVGENFEDTRAHDVHVLASCLGGKYPPNEGGRNRSNLRAHNAHVPAGLLWVVPICPTKLDFIPSRCTTCDPILRYVSMPDLDPISDVARACVPSTAHRRCPRRSRVSS